MTEILSTVFIIGAALVDSLEAWVLVLMVLVIVIDLIAGIRRKPLMVFSFFQVAGLVAGYLWASQVALKQDVSGPYAWAFVVGFWCVFAVIFHIAMVLIRLMSPRQKP